MKKILHVTISDCENERRILNEALGAAGHGYRVEILALKTPHVSRIRSFGPVVIRRLSVKHWRGGPAKFLGFNYRLLRELLRQPYDILHAHDLWVLPAAALASRLRNRPLVYDAHEYFPGLKIFQTKKISGFIWRLAESLFIRQADALIAINEFHRQLYRKRYPLLKRARVIMNLPSLSEVPPELSARSFAEREKAVLFQGILKPGRGLYQALAAMEQVSEGGLKIVGYGELEEELRRRVAQTALRERVEFTGKADLRQLPALTAGCRAGLALFQPDSLNYRYASPNKFFEYVMAGTPVIASQIPSFHQFLKAYEVGILVDPADVGQISRAITLLLNDRRRWEVYHQNCLRAREMWNWERQEEQLLGLYAEI